MNIASNDSIAHAGQAAAAANIRMHALEDRLLALQADLPAVTLQGLLGELNAAFAELLDIAGTEIRTPRGGRIASKIAATNES